MKVNPHFLTELLAPITGLADDDAATSQYGDIDLNDPQDALYVIRTLIVPYARSLGPSMRQHISLAYSYYLEFGDIRWDRVFDSVLPPFETPKDVKSFLRLAYEESFGPAVKLEHAEDIVVVADTNEPLRVWQNDRERQIDP